jgi:hypothetical protein
VSTGARILGLLGSAFSAHAFLAHEFSRDDRCVRRLDE